MKPRTSWAEKVQKDATPVVKPLDRRFAGHDVGELMLISSAKDVNTRIRRKKSGTAITIPEFRERLAKSANAYFTCPLSTGIFLRVVAEAALEALSAGDTIEEVTPFWRVIEPTSTLAQKLSCGPNFISQRRRIEKT